MRKEGANTFVDGDTTPPFGVHKVAEPNMTKLMQIAQGEFKALSQRGIFPLPDIVLVEGNRTRRRAIRMNIFSLIALDYAASYAPNVPHGERIVLRHKDLAVLPEGKRLPGERLEESNASLYNIEHLFRIDLVSHQLSCKNFQNRTILDLAVLLNEWSYTD